MESASGSGASPAPDWYPDPTSRHQHRYWDGSAWTDHVADEGLQSVDPVGGTWSLLQVEELVDAIIREYRERMEIGDSYEAEVKATGGFEWHTPEMDACRARIGEIEAAGLAASASAGLRTLGPSALRPVIDAVSKRRAEIQSWNGMSKSALEQALSEVLLALDSDRGAHAADELKTLFFSSPEASHDGEMP